MTRKLVRLGDENSAGGRALDGDRSFIVDGRPVCVVGTPVSPHAPCPDEPAHCNAVTQQGEYTMIIGNIKANVTGDVDSCGHVRTQGSDTFIIG